MLGFRPKKCNLQDLGIGQNVFFKSGSPVMTIIGIEYDNIEVKWSSSDGKITWSDKFPYQCLMTFETAPIVFDRYNRISPICLN